MKVERKQLNELFEYLGSDNSPNWEDAVILKKCNNPGHLEVLRDGGDIVDVKLARLYNSIKDCVESGGTVELEGAPVKENGKPKAAPKAKKEAAEKPKAPAKAKAKAKPSANGKAKKEAAKDLRGPGVIDQMIVVLQTASKTKPLTKKQVLEQLAKKFKDRNPASMWNTTSSYIPNRIFIERGYKVDTDENGGFWIGPKGNVGRPSKAEAEKLLASLRRPSTIAEEKPEPAKKGKAKASTKDKSKKKPVKAK